MAILGYAELEDAGVLVKSLGTIFLVVFWASKWCLGDPLTPPHFRALTPKKSPIFFIRGSTGALFWGLGKIFF